MLRTIDIIMIGLLLGGAAFTFKIKHDSELAIERVAELERQIQAERDAIDILKADWSLLASPKRLEALVEKYRDELALEPLDPANIGSLDEVPARIELMDEGADQGIAGILENDETSTGSTTKQTGDQQ